MTNEQQAWILEDEQAFHADNASFEVWRAMHPEPNWPPAVRAAWLASAREARQQQAVRYAPLVAAARMYIKACDDYLEQQTQTQEMDTATRTIKAVLGELDGEGQ